MLSGSVVIHPQMRSFQYTTENTLCLQVTPVDRLIIAKMGERIRFGDFETGIHPTFYFVFKHGRLKKWLT
jgi:hypothetical protein